MSVKSNYEEWKRNMQETQRQFKKELAAATPVVGARLQSAIRNRIPPGATTSAGMRQPFPGYAAKGDLKNSVTVSPVRHSGQNRYSVHVAVAGPGASKLQLIKALVHEYGTIIQGNPYLKFRIFNQWVQVESVQIRAKGYFRAAIEEVRAEFPRLVAEHLRRGTFGKGLR
jgi:hypothetical protein